MTQPTLYSMPSSGNSYKIRLLFALTGHPYRHVPCEAGSPELTAARAAGHLPLGTLPALHLATGETLGESGAILHYLAQGTPYWPDAPIAQAQTLAWMFFEQNRLEPVIAVRAALRSYPHRADEATPDRMADLLTRGIPLLQTLDAALGRAPWFGGARPSIADIALYGYTHSAGTRGGYDLAPLTALTDWCNRVASLPGYVGLEHVP